MQDSFFSATATPGQLNQFALLDVKNSVHPGETLPFRDSIVTVPQ